MSLSDRITEGMPFSDAHQLYLDFLASSESLAPEGERKWAILPEAIAAVHAYCESRAAADGLYVLIDVGAGTTNVSVFRFSRDFETPVAFYASHTAAVGADDIDRSLATMLAQKHSPSGDASVNLLHDVRLAKQESADGSLRLSSGWVLSRDEVLRAESPTIDRIWNVYFKAFGLAYQREQLVSRWSSLNVVLVGGGTLIPNVRTRLLKPPRDFVTTIAPAVMRIPSFRGGPSGALTGVNASVLLTVGFGLSFARAQIPDYWRTESVEPIGPQRARVPEPEDWR